MAIMNLPPLRQSCPAVSVIIPLYNAEKYIADCLESLLAQTFQNFEVIVVDDCSTDSSPAIVESYREKFGGRLIFSRMDSNTGSGAMPRNKGMRLSRGEYITFMDNDDLITPTALEELYTLAKDYDADVVYCEKNYRAKDDGTFLDIEINQNETPVDKPTFETDNMVERVQNILQGKYRVPQWLKFTRRSLIFEHEIFFPNTRPSDDVVWTYGLVFYAKKFLRVPNAVYTRRLSDNSIMRLKKNAQQTITFWANPAILGLKALDKLMGKHEFFQQNPQYRYAVLEAFANGEISHFLNDTFQLPSFAVYETIRQTFGDKLGEQDVLVSALCTLVNTQQKISLIYQQKLNEVVTQSQDKIKNLNRLVEQSQNRISNLEKQLRDSQQFIAELKARNELTAKTTM